MSTARKTTIQKGAHFKLFGILVVCAFVTPFNVATILARFSRSFLRLATNPCPAYPFDIHFDLGRQKRQCTARQ